LRENGTKMYFIIYDILPIKFPEYFTSAGVWFLNWLRFVVNNASGVICISKTVADEFIAWCESGNEERSRPLLVGYFHLGADYRPPNTFESKTLSSLDLETAIKYRKSVLMVGTIEPRKGHRQALEAMNRLWSIEYDVNLIIAGKRGWMMDSFFEELTSHREFGKRLFWLEDLSDEQLRGLYQSATVLLAASVGEGFGLPLIEAARYGLPIIARDIAVFREVMGKNAVYFSGPSPQELADALRLWFRRFVDQNVPMSSALPILTWRESAMQLAEVIFRNKWYVCWRSLALPGHSGRQ
jgi:glycosyltransferase involved in cell wall biosynthesis